MRIHFERSGGFAPAAMKRSVTVDTETLPADEARELVSLVESANLANLPPPSGPRSARPDAFSYTLTIEDGGRQQTVCASDAEMPEAMYRLVAWLRKRAV
jgi:hypothetical protein